MGFLHEHKLSSENDFHSLLQGGKTFMNYPLKFLCVVQKSETPSFKVAISVPKKRFHHAVDRNLVKRRIREGIRHIYPQKDFNSLAIKTLIVYCDNSIASQQTLEGCIANGFTKIEQYARNL
ncbi:MAG: ribonuclease P protein component [Bacteroidales bacterium]|nr:ribonuclease P protein component [Bacteroidales bacterium]